MPLWSHEQGPKPAIFSRRGSCRKAFYTIARRRAGERRG
jgi:hypothetical protein